MMATLEIRSTQPLISQSRDQKEVLWLAVTNAVTDFVDGGVCYRGLYPFFNDCKSKFKVSCAVFQLQLRNL